MTARAFLPQMDRISRQTHAGRLLMTLPLYLFIPEMQTQEAETIVKQTPPVQFRHVGEAHVTYREWMLIVPIKFAQYGRMIDKIEQEVTRFEDTLTKIATDYEDTTYSPKLQKPTAAPQIPVHAHTLRVVENQMIQYKEEIGQLRGLYDELREAFLTPPEEPQGIITGATRREKRSLLPSWMTYGFGYLTGLSSQDQTDAIRRRIQILSTDTEKIATTVDHGMTLLNTTVMHAKQNRKAITHLAEAVEAMQKSYGEMEGRILTWFTDVQVMTTTLNGMMLAMNAATSLIRRCHAALQTLRSQMQTAITGRYPWDLMNKEDVKTFSDHLRDELSKTYMLPYQAGELQQLLYQLPTVVVGDDQDVHILIRLPLSHHDDLYNMYVIDAVPLPEVKNGTIKQYILETEALAVTQDNLRYRPMDMKTAIGCGDRRIRHCTLTGPSYDMTDAPLCVTSLFTKDKNAVNDRCQLENIPKPSVPIIKDLGRGQWMMFTTEDERLTLQCLHDEYKPMEMINLPMGTNQLTLPPGCRASTQKFRLPPYIDGRTEISLNNADQAVDDLNDGDWNAYIRAPTLRLPEIQRDVTTAKLAPLDEYAEATRHHIDYMQADLRPTRERDEEGKDFTTPIRGLLIGIVIVALLISIATAATYYTTRRSIVQMGRKLGLIRRPPPTDAERPETRVIFTRNREEQIYEGELEEPNSKKRKVQPTAPMTQGKELPQRQPPPKPARLEEEDHRGHNAHLGMCMVATEDDEAASHDGMLSPTPSDGPTHGQPKATFMGYLDLKPVREQPRNYTLLEGEDDIGPSPRVLKTLGSPSEIDEALRRLLDPVEPEMTVLNTMKTAEIEPTSPTTTYPTLDEESVTDANQPVMPPEMPTMTEERLERLCRSPMKTEERIGQWLDQQIAAPDTETIIEMTDTTPAVQLMDRQLERMRRMETPTPSSDSSEPQDYSTEEIGSEDDSNSEQQRRILRPLKKLQRANRPPKFDFTRQSSTPTDTPATLLAGMTTEAPLRLEDRVTHEPEKTPTNDVKTPNAGSNNAEESLTK